MLCNIRVATSKYTSRSTPALPLMLLPVVRPLPLSLFITTLPVFAFTLLRTFYTPNRNVNFGRHGKSKCLADLCEIEFIDVKYLFQRVWSVWLEVRSVAISCGLVQVVIFRNEILKLCSCTDQSSDDGSQCKNIPVFEHLRLSSGGIDIR